MINNKDDVISSYQKNEEKIQQLRRLIKSRDTEIIELVKDSNKKTIYINNLEIQLEDSKLKVDELESIIKLKNEEYTFKQEQDKNL